MAVKAAAQAAIGRDRTRAIADPQAQLIGAVDVVQTCQRIIVVAFALTLGAERRGSMEKPCA
ncbi:hypothetical protein MGSAQ_000566 [marine sediment metagenome]|uniref:Uncharacterized protein n=1 Tax=marine sediment metagenome TaxID=412755 RepID=A0A1B6NX43_9ZZZZ